MRRAADVAPLGHGKVLYLHGSAYEQGKQLGRGAADLIHENIRRASRLRDDVAAGRDQADYAAITRDALGRRIDLVRLHDSAQLSQRWHRAGRRRVVRRGARALGRMWNRTRTKAKRLA